MPPRPRTLKERFDEKWRLDEASQCWIWEGALTIHGYGKMQSGGALRAAHRISWEMKKGKIPEGLVLDHLCRRKNCVNPDHLDPVSVGENSKRRNYEFWRILGDMPTLRSPKKQRQTLRERFDSKWKEDPETGCWEWMAPLSSSGYGTLSVDAGPRLAHRVGYEIYVGPIPAGLQIDHLCRNRRCVNPVHLEPVTNAENGRRGVAAETNRRLRLSMTHCKSGHPLSGRNLAIDRWSGQRVCRTCRASRKKKYRSANAQSRNPNPP